MESSSIAKHEVKMNYHALEQEIKVWIRENGCFMYPTIFFSRVMNYFSAENGQP